MPREAPVTSAIREARGGGIEVSFLRSRPPRTRGPIRREGYDGRRRSCLIWFEQLTPGLWVPAFAGTTPLALLARFRQQRQLPRLRLGLRQVGERGGIVAGKTVIGEFRMRGIAAGLAHGTVDAIDRQERQRIRADQLAHL